METKISDPSGDLERPTLKLYYSCFVAAATAQRRNNFEGKTLDFCCTVRQKTLLCKAGADTSKVPLVFIGAIILVRFTVLFKAIFAFHTLIVEHLIKKFNW
jgi:hypothetical protein